MYLLVSLVSFPRMIRKLNLPTPLLEIKMSAAALHHGLNTLKVLMAHSGTSSKFCDEICARIVNEQSQNLSKNSIRVLRNVLFHYGITHSIATRLEEELPYRGFFEAAVNKSPEETLLSLRTDIDCLWTSFSNVLELVCSKRIKYDL